MQADTLSETATETFDLPNGLHRHRSRQKWGYGVAVNHHDGVVDWQFQDGKLRRIAKSFCHLLEAVDLPADEDEAISVDLIARAGLTVARRQREAEDGAPLLTLDEQVSRFLLRFPGGFEDEKWVKDHRGEDAKRRLKRHRNAAIADAQEHLTEEELRGMLASGQPEKVVETVLSVLEACNLTTKKARSLLDKMRPMDVEPIAHAWVELLHGEGKIDMRMLRLLTPLRHLGKPNWALVTGPLALLHPDEHITVQPKAFREQAKWMAPRLTLHHQPDGAQYERLRRMALRLRNQLVERDMAPRDLMDVFDFMVLSLKPVKKKDIRAPKATETDAKQETEEAAAEAA